MDSYAVQVYCEQCQSYQTQLIPKGKRRDYAEDLSCPNCGIKGELELVEE